MFGFELVDIIYAISAIILMVAAHRLAIQMRNGKPNDVPANEPRSESLPAGVPVNER